ncbi:TPM domain-containing protein [Chitinophagaceae bacterium MMS25-I14]
MFFFRKKKDLLSPEAQEMVVAALREAERGTTGEIRIFIESKCAYVDAMDRAREIFQQLRMEKTTRRNAVLIYLALDHHQFAIMGDVEIYEKAGGPAFWEKAAERLREYLSGGMVAEGLCVCLAELAKTMAAHFPYDPDVAKNELPDEIVFGK